MMVAKALSLITLVALRVLVTLSSICCDSTLPEACVAGGTSGPQYTASDVGLSLVLVRSVLSSCNVYRELVDTAWHISLHYQLATFVYSLQME